MPESFGKRVYLILFGLILVSMIILTIHFREGENGPIHRSQRFILAATAPLQAAVQTALSPVRDGWAYLVHFGDLTRENHALKQEVAELKSEVLELKGLESENARLRSLVGLEERKKYRTIAAHVLGMPASNWWSSIIVNRGRADGVRPSMPVMAGGGLVGQVQDVSENVTKVMLLNDVQSGVSAQVQRTGEVGIIKGQLKDKKLVLQYISHDSTIRKGDTILTSGLGGIFPKALYIGKVTAVREPTYSLYKIVEVATPVDFVNLSEVLIIAQTSGFSFKESN